MHTSIWCTCATELVARRGQEYVRNWMRARFQLILQPDGQQGAQILGTFAKFSAEVSQAGGEQV